MMGLQASLRERREAPRLLASLALSLLPSLVLLGPWQASIPQAWARGAILAGGGALAGLLLPPRVGAGLWRAVFGALASAAIYYLLIHFAAITPYPFSITWSEGNRFWTDSLLYRRGDYPGLTRDIWPAYATTGLDGLLGLPFLFGRPSIAWLRIWDVSLQVFPPLALGIAVFLGEKAWGSWAIRGSLALWGGLFVAQGTPFAPIVIAGIAMALGVRREHWGRTLAVTAAVSFYLGISRWTWMIALAIWMGTWKLLSLPDPKGGRWRRVASLALAGGVGAALSVLWRVGVERGQPFHYLSDLRHPMLWYRLFPNATSPLGILPWIVLVALPPGLFIIWVLWREAHDRWWHLFVVGVGSAIFMAIGVLASAKMGGGDNLHHFDMFLIYITLIIGAVGSHRLSGARVPGQRGIASAILAVILLLPITYAASLRNPLIPPALNDAEARLRTIQDAIASAGARGPVLFIDQRQLVTFGLVPSVSAAWEYESGDLMDHAMARDEAYLARFYADLEGRRFSMIISYPLHVVSRGQTYPFGDENDIWVETVVHPVLENYRPVVELDDVGVWLLEPISEHKPR